MTDSTRIIWQYWETRGEKPAFIDGLHDLVVRRSGLESIVVTPETLETHLPDLEPEIRAIPELAHKADMIRTRLIHRHGGMWLDSDAVVMKDLDWILDELAQHDFVGFSDESGAGAAKVKINCFAARAGSVVMGEWVRAQADKLPRTSFDWTELGSEILDPICARHADRVRLYPFERISPVSWRQVRRFGDRGVLPGAELDGCDVVMLSNKVLEKKLPQLRRMTVEEIAASGIYLSHFLRRAMDPGYVPVPTLYQRAKALLTGS